jgi:hypothetical protein
VGVVVGVAVGGTRVKVAVGNGVAAGTGVGVSLTTASTVASISGDISVFPLQLTNSITAEARRSSNMNLGSIIEDLPYVLTAPQVPTNITNAAENSKFDSRSFLN